MASKRSEYKRTRLTDDERESDAVPFGGSSFCSKLNNPLVFSILSMLAIAMNAAGFTYLTATLTTLERRFRLKSQQAAFLPMIIEAFGVLYLLFVVHFGASRHRPRVMSLVLVLSGLGLLLFCVPHFLHPIPSFLQEHEPGSNSTQSHYNAEADVICTSRDGDVTEEACDDDEREESGALLNQAIWLFLGAVLLGFNTSFYPLFITHIDDGVRKKHMSTYLGVLFAVFMVGLLIAFLLASVCLRIPAYITDQEFRELTPADPRFLGAWWLGFLVIGVLQLIFAIPVFFFPRFLPKPRDDDFDTEDNFANTTEMNDMAVATAKLDLKLDEGDNFLSGLLKAVWRVVSIPTLFFSYCAYVAWSLYFAGTSTFGPKYMEEQFSLDPSTTAFFFAISMLPPGFFGNLLGAIAVRFFGKTRRGIASVVMFAALGMMLLLPLSFVFGCRNADIAGLTVNYGDHAGGWPELPKLQASCNYECDCSNVVNPVCGSDGVTYASACVAGCRETESNETLYTDCSCVYSTGPGDVMTNTTDQSAIQGICQDDTVICQYLIPYLVWITTVMTFGVMTAIPLSLVQLRSVELRDRAMGMAVCNIAGKLLGYLPGPILYGIMIDSACLLFQSSCGETGNCIFYDIEKFRYYYIGLNNGLCLIATFFVLLTYLSIRRGWDEHKQPSVDDEEYDEAKYSMRDTPSI